MSPGVATPAVTGRASQNSQHWAPCTPPLPSAKVSSSSYRHSLRARMEHGTADNPRGQALALQEGPRSTLWQQEQGAVGAGCAPTLARL